MEKLYKRPWPWPQSRPWWAPRTKKFIRGQRRPTHCWRWMRLWITLNNFHIKVGRLILETKSQPLGIYSLKFCIFVSSYCQCYFCAIIAYFSFCLFCARMSFVSLSSWMSSMKLFSFERRVLFYFSNIWWVSSYCIISCCFFFLFDADKKSDGLSSGPNDVRILR